MFNKRKGFLLLSAKRKIIIQQKKIEYIKQSPPPARQLLSVTQQSRTRQKFVTLESGLLSFGVEHAINKFFRLYLYVETKKRNKSLNHYSFCYLKCNADSSNLDAANIICESLAISDTLFFYDSTDLKMDNNNEQWETSEHFASWMQKKRRRIRVENENDFKGNLKFFLFCIITWILIRVGSGFGFLCCYCYSSYETGLCIIVHTSVSTLVVWTIVVVVVVVVRCKYHRQCFSDFHQFSA